MGLLMNDSVNSTSMRQAVEEMSVWLQESEEYGTAPQSIQVIASYRAPWPWEPEEQELHLVHFVLPNGREGVGISGPIAWSFSDRAIDFSQFENDELLRLYAGWYLIFELLEDPDYRPEFPPEDDLEMIQILEKEHGIRQIKIMDRIRIEDQTFFEMTGVDDGKPCRIAGSFEGCFSFYEDDKYYGLPALYYVMGCVFYSDDDQGDEAFFGETETVDDEGVGDEPASDQQADDLGGQKRAGGEVAGENG